MLSIWIEFVPAVWARYEVSHEERRQLLLASGAMHRWTVGDQLFLSFNPLAATIGSGQKATSDFATDTPDA